MIFSALISFVTPIINLLPDFNLTGFSDQISPVWDFFRLLGYVIPLTAFVPLFVIIIGITVAPFIISLVKTIWAMLPIA